MKTPLYDLAKALDGFKFPDVGNERAAIFHEWDQLDSVVHYLKRPNYRYRFWTVQLFIGGMLRNIGTTLNGVDAARFADMAAIRFAKYRKRRLAEDQVQLNFSYAEAKQDEVDCPQAVELLDDIEEYFLDCGVIERPGPDQKVERKSRGLRSDMMALHEETMAALAELKRQIESLRKTAGATLVVNPPAPVCV